MVLLVKVLIILLIILLGACGIATYRSDNEQKKTLMALFCVGAFSMIMYAVYKQHHITTFNFAHWIVILNIKFYTNVLSINSSEPSTKDISSTGIV